MELAVSIPRADLLARLKDAGLAHQMRKLRDNRWHLEVGGPDSGLYFYLGHMNADGVRKLASRPSAFPSFAAYRSALSKMLSEQELSETRLTRLDLALDYPAPLGVVLHGLDVSQKQVRIAYTDKGATRTGLAVGCGPERIVVYDKALKSKLAEPRTRIETQLSGAKLPTRKLDDLPALLASHKGRLFFGNVSLSEVVVADATGLQEGQISRFADLRSMLNREGLLSAKRAFNANGNFERDYAGFLQITPASEQPAQAFRRLIRDFFEERSDGESPILFHGR